MLFEIACKGCLYASNYEFGCELTTFNTVEHQYRVLLTIVENTMVMDSASPIVGFLKTSSNAEVNFVHDVLVGMSCCNPRSSTYCCERANRERSPSARLLQRVQC